MTVQFSTAEKVRERVLLDTNTVARLATANVCLRYNVAEGHDRWVVYGHQANLNREMTSPPALGTAHSGLLVKYTRSFGT